MKKSRHFVIHFDRTFRVPMHRAAIVKLKNLRYSPKQASCYRIGAVPSSGFHAIVVSIF